MQSRLIVKMPNFVNNLFMYHNKTSKVCITKEKSERFNSFIGKYVKNNVSQ